eukprot:8035755-Pyramimonas_sp.AAC.1
MARGRHLDPATGAFGGAPFGAAERVRGAPRWPEAATWTLQLEPSVELPVYREGGVCSLWGRKRVLGVLKWPEAAMRILLLGANGGAPFGAASRVR